MLAASSMQCLKPRASHSSSCSSMCETSVLASVLASPIVTSSMLAAHTHACHTHATCISRALPHHPEPVNLQSSERADKGTRKTASFGQHASSRRQARQRPQRSRARTSITALMASWCWRRNSASSSASLLPRSAASLHSACEASSSLHVSASSFLRCWMSLSSGSLESCSSHTTFFRRSISSLASASSAPSSSRACSAAASS